MAHGFCRRYPALFRNGIPRMHWAERVFPFVKSDRIGFQHRKCRNRTEQPQWPAAAPSQPLRNPPPDGSGTCKRGGFFGSAENECSFSFDCSGMDGTAAGLPGGPLHVSGRNGSSYGQQTRFRHSGSSICSSVDRNPDSSFLRTECPSGRSGKHCAMMIFPEE